MIAFLHDPFRVAPSSYTNRNTLEVSIRTTSKERSGGLARHPLPLGSGGCRARGERLLLVTHCWPTPERPTAGVWLERLWPAATVLLLPRFPLRWWWYAKQLREAAGYHDAVVAVWAFPAGLLCWLGRVRYTLIAMGKATLAITASKVLSFFLRPIYARASRVMCISRYIRDRLVRRFGLWGDVRVQYLPPSWGEEEGSCEF
jgi:hypothetical protein